MFTRGITGNLKYSKPPLLGQFQFMKNVYLQNLWKVVF